MGRAPCCSKVGLRRGPWSIKEDTILTNYIQEHGEGQWKSLPKNAGLLRCGKSCRLRWMNYLRPGIKRGDISQDEEDLIVRLHKLLGNRWSLIAGRLPGRTDNEIKNYWNTHLIKKLKKAGINPAAKPQKDTSKPAKAKKPADGKRKKKQKKTQANAKKLPSGSDIMNTTENELIKPKVYLPKPIRVSSSVFSRTNSYDSLVSGSSSSDGGVAAAMEGWPPLLELGDDFTGVGLVMPVVKDQSDDSMSSDVNLWEKVYEEFFQLL